MLTALIWVAAFGFAAFGFAAAQDAPAIFLFEDPALSANRLHYLLMIAGGRGYRILCASQADEEAVIHGLGFTTVSTILSAVDPAIVAAHPADNPKICPTGPSFPIKVFAAEGPGGLVHYLQFPADFGSPAFADRLYVPGCLGLVDALGLDLAAALAADPTPFFVGKIHEITCLNGAAIPTVPDSFADWCLKADRTPAETATVMALLDATPGGVTALGNASACGSAETFLRTITTLNLNGKGVQSLEPLSVLPQLTSLSLSGNDITVISPLSKLVALGFLDLKGNKISNLTALAPLTVLTELTLTDNDITDIRPLAPLKALSSFDAAGNPVALPDFLSACLMRHHQEYLSHEQQVEVDALLGVSGQSRCQPANDDLAQRKFADFRNLGLTSLVYFRLMQDLEAVDLSGNGLNDVVGLQSLPALTRIVVRQNNITSVSSFRPLRGLEQLILDENPISSLIGISELSKLKRLHFSNTNVRSVLQLADLPLLEAAEMRNLPLSFDNFREYCIVNRFDPLSLGAVRSFMLAIDARLDADHVDQSDCASVEAWVQTQRVLTLNKKQISDLDPLIFFTELEELHLFDNLVTDVRPIASLRKLVKLNLDTNRIATLPRFASEGLAQLYLSNNLIVDVTPLASLHALGRIELRNNRIPFITPLLANTSVNVFDLRDNQIVVMQPQDIPVLTRSYLGGNPVCQIGPTIFPMLPFQIWLEACQRTPPLIVIDFQRFDLDVLAVQPGVTTLNPCGQPGSVCPTLHVRPEIFLSPIHPWPFAPPER